MVTETDLKHLRRCVELAEEALNDGDAAFGSVLVSGDGKVLAEDRNRISTVDATRHPEFELARWAAANMTPEERAKATVYTSGEHCPQCSSAHGLAGLGRIVYASSAKQFEQWMEEIGIDDQPIALIPVEKIIKNIEVAGPAPELADEIFALHKRYYNIQ